MANLRGRVVLGLVPMTVASVFVLWLATGAYGGTYYVSKKGRDRNPGTEARPWKTIRKAAKTLLAGDTVYIKAGTYRERVVPSRSGSADKYITYSAYPGDRVTIDGSGKTIDEMGGLFDLSGRSYIKVSGLRVVNSSQIGILADGSTGIIIESNYTYNTGSSGIAAWGSRNVIIDANEVVRACNGELQESITVADTDSFEIRNNYVHDVGNPDKEGIDAKDGASNGKIFGNRVHDTGLGIYVDAWNKHTYNIEVSGNTVHDNGGDGITLASEQGGLLENVRVFNNISFNNTLNGIDISACCTRSHPMKDIVVVNNTFYRNGRDWGQGIYIENPQVENFVFRNNICSQNLTFQIALDSAVPAGVYTIDHNLIDGVSETYGESWVEGDPAFVDPSRGDFHLREGSPAIRRRLWRGRPTH
jgi:parallel beta-helix repeat protein